MKNFFLFLLSFTVFFGCLSGCNNSKKSSRKKTVSSDTFYLDDPEIQNEIDYVDLYGQQTAEQKASIDSLFYENNFNTDGADPACIYCEKDGYFYMYTTGHYDVLTYRSRDLNHWEHISASFYNTYYYAYNDNYASNPDAVSQRNWSKALNVSYDDYKDVINPNTGELMTEAEFNNYYNNTWVRYGYIWAPGVIYDETLDLYLMYFSARYTNAYPETYQIGLATSKTPAGPFVQWTGTVEGGRYENGQSFNSYNIDYSTPFIDFERLNGVDGNYPYEGYIKVIDVEPFVDPVTGDKYLYMVRDLGEGTYSTSGVMGMKMKDWFTPDYSTLTLLTQARKTRVTDAQSMVENDEGDVNEGPFCVYNAESGKYILTYSCNNYLERSYKVKQAIADSPLGPFTKVSQEKGGWIIASGVNWPQRSGTGHHCFVTVGDEMFIVYHMHFRPEKFRTDNRIDGRRIAVDKVVWKKNQDGDLILVANGPSVDYRLCPKSFNGGYYNVAEYATVTTSEGGDNVGIINDGLVKFHAKGVAQDYFVRANALSVTLNFKTHVSAKTILVYNAFNMKYAFENIERIEIDYVNGQGKTERAVIGQAVFDWETFYTNNINLSTNLSVYVTGCASGVMFDEISDIFRINVYLAKQNVNKSNGAKIREIGLSDIQVIGKI